MLEDTVCFFRVDGRSRHLVVGSYRPIFVDYTSLSSATTTPPLACHRELGGRVPDWPPLPESGHTRWFSGRRCCLTGGRHRVSSSGLFHAGRFLNHTQCMGSQPSQPKDPRFQAPWAQRSAGRSSAGANIIAGARHTGLKIIAGMFTALHHAAAGAAEVVYRVAVRHRIAGPHLIQTKFTAASQMIQTLAPTERRYTTFSFVKHRPHHFSGHFFGAKGKQKSVLPCKTK